MKTQRKAFTVIEIVVALGVILVLVGMITVAVTKVLDSSRGSSTNTFLQTGVSLFDEWNRRTQTEYPTHVLPLVTNVDGNNVPGVPGDIKTGSPDLFGVGVALTRGTMNRFAAHPAVKRLMGNMPQDRWIALPGNPVAATALPTTVNIGQTLTGTYTDKGTASKQRYFVCYNGPSADASAAAPTDPNPASWPANWREFWLEVGTGGINVLNDGWNNPVLFIPACGFEARDVNGNVILVTADGTKTNDQIHPTGSTFVERLAWSASKSYNKGQIVMSQPAGTPTQWSLFICSNNHTATATNKPDTALGRKVWDRMPVKPFFASAGSDGIFFDPNEPETLLDNLYSFER